MISSAKFQKISQTRTPEQQDKKLREVGELYEKQFLREMVKAMRGTVSEGGFIKANHAEKIFREQLDHEYVEKWGAKGGIGLADLIHQQLVDKYGPQLGIRPRIDRPQGPLPLDIKSNYTAKTLGADANSAKVSMQFSKDMDEPSLGITTLKMPWQGKLLDSTKLGADEYLLNVAHGNGLKSQFVFRGQTYPGVMGQDLEAGESIGLLSPEARAFFWNVEPVSIPVSK